MSTIKSKKVQLGTDANAANNFTLYQPATPDGTLRIGVGNADSPTEVAQFTSAGLVSGVSKLDTATGAAPSYSARAWVNFNGQGTVAIRDSGNVSSITDTGVGSYVVNFAVNMPNDNYATAVSAKQEANGTDGMPRLSSDYNSSAVRVFCLQNAANTAIDCHTVTVMCIG